MNEVVSTPDAMAALLPLRQQIDQLDSQLVELLAARAKVTAEGTWEQSKYGMQ